MRDLGNFWPWATHLGITAGATLGPLMQWVAFAWVAVHIILMAVCVVGGRKYVKRARWVLDLTLGRRPGPPPSAPPPTGPGSPSS